MTKMIETEIELIEFDGIQAVIDVAASYKVVATRTDYLCPNGFPTWKLEGLEADLEQWYNEYYCAGSPEQHNGFRFDILGIDD